MSTVMRTKFFECRQYYRKTSEQDITGWQLLHENSGVPVDKQLNIWLETTNFQVVGVSAPGIQHFWLDDQRSFKCLIVGIIVTYVESPVQLPTDVAPPNFGGPVGEQNDRPASVIGNTPPGAPGAVNIRRPTAPATKFNYR